MRNEQRILALTEELAKLETEVARLRAQLIRKDYRIEDLQDQVSELEQEDLLERIDTCKNLLVEYINADYMGISPPDPLDLYVIYFALCGKRPKFIGSPEMRHVDLQL